jgi:hypothetical protein
MPSRYVFELPLLGRPTKYFDCPHCGYLQTETPYWLEEAYAQPINDCDTGIMSRNRLNVGRVIMTLLAYRRLHGTVIDHAGGYGILVRLLRDAGVEARWRDKYCTNLLARGFEAGPSDKSDLLTAFEVLEHMIEPVEEIKAMLNQSAIVLVSTELLAEQSEPSPDWWYLGPEHGQHIGFFRPQTLGWIAKKLGCSFASDGLSIHIFSRDPVPAGWRAALRLRRVWPLIARLRLKPKIMDDFDTMRRQRNGR